MPHPSSAMYQRQASSIPYVHWGFMTVRRRFLLAPSFARLIQRERGGLRHVEGFFPERRDRSSWVRLEENKGLLILRTFGPDGEVEDQTDIRSPMLMRCSRSAPARSTTPGQPCQSVRIMPWSMRSSGPVSCTSSLWSSRLKGRRGPEVGSLNFQRERHEGEESSCLPRDGEANLCLAPQLRPSCHARGASSAP